MLMRSQPIGSSLDVVFVISIISWAEGRKDLCKITGLNAFGTVFTSFFYADDDFPNPHGWVCV